MVCLDTGKETQMNKMITTTKEVKELLEAIIGTLKKEFPNEASIIVKEIIKIEIKID